MSLTPPTEGSHLAMLLSASDRVTRIGGVHLPGSAQRLSICATRVPTGGRTAVKVIRTQECYSFHIAPLIESVKIERPRPTRTLYEHKSPFRRFNRAPPI